MKVSPIRTRRIESGAFSLRELVDEYFTDLTDGSVVVIASKIVSLCEKRLVQKQDKEKLICQEAHLFLDKKHSKYQHHFTIRDNILIGSAGIDESNVSKGHLLLPEDSQKTANDIRQYLTKKFNHQNLGVIITDSTSTPLQLGTTGIYLAHSGFLAVNDYVGQPDLFGKKYAVSRQNVANGLAAAAVVTMGEGTEQTPLCVISDVPFVSFQNRNPNQQELKNARPTIDEDLFEPFLSGVQWQKGQR